MTQVGNKNIHKASYTNAVKVICAGPGKTGTKTIVKALRILGLTVYDWEEQTFDFLDHWVDVFQNGTKPDVKRVYKNADAAADMQASFFFEEILEAFPDCKVILTERNEDAWVKSLANQLEVFYTAKYGLRFLAPLSPTLKNFFFVLMSFIDAMFGSRNPRSTFVFRKRYRVQDHCASRKTLGLQRYARMETTVRILRM